MNDPMFFSKHLTSAGPRVFFQHRPLPFFGSTFMVHGGSRHDPPGKEELLHLVEHLLSSGTQGMPRMSLMELERWLNAERLQCGLGETHLDYSAYHGKASVDRMDRLIGFLHGLTIRPTLDSELDKERDIIRREREESSTVEERETDRVRRLAVFGSHRLAEVGGWATDEVLDRLTLADAKAAHALHYDPKNMTIIAVGGVDEDALLACIERTFGPTDAGYAPPPRQPLPVFGIPEPREYLQRKDGKVTKMEVRYIWHLRPSNRSPLALIRNALQESLFDKLREKMRATYGVNVSDMRMEDHQVFAISTQVTPGRVGVARGLIEAAVRDVQAVANELPRLKDDYRLALEFLECDVSEALERAAIAINAVGRPRTVAEVITALDSIGADDVRDLMEKELSPERAFVELVEQ